MVVVFVYSLGRSDIGRPTILSQADALGKNGLDIRLVPLAGSGVLGYLKKIRLLKKRIAIENPDLIHAHYSYNGFISAIATRKPIVTSLMGGDVNDSGFWRAVIRLFVKYIWSITIVKSEEMYRKLRLDPKLIHIVPNGVNFDLYKPVNKEECRKTLGWDKDMKIVLFGGNPKNKVKNYYLANQAFQQIKNIGYELKCLVDVSPNDIPIYLNASDVILLTSHSEGSPNIVKEAMACNVPVVSTDVGDVRWLLDNVSNSYVAENTPTDIANKLILVLDTNSSSNGRDQLKKLGLESESFALRIQKLYESILC